MKKLYFASFKKSTRVLPTWLLHFVPTPYSGKVTKGQRPTLNRYFFLIKKTELAAFLTPSAIQGLI